MVQIARLVTTMEADPSEMLAAFAAVQKGTLGLAADLERLSTSMQSNLATATDRAAAGLSRVSQPSQNASKALGGVGDSVNRVRDQVNRATPVVDRVSPSLSRIGPSSRTGATGLDTLARTVNTGRDSLGRFTGASRQAAEGATAMGGSVDKAGSAFGRLVTRINAAQKALAEGFTPAQKAAKEIADRFQSAGTKLTLGVTLPIAFAAGSTVQAAAEMDSLKRGLLAVAGSAEETERQLARLQDVAKLPGLGFQEAIRGSISLQAAGFSARSAERSLQAFGNALATVGKGKADLDGVTLALTQIASKGKISAEEINQLSERVPQVRKAMQAAFGSADPEKLQKSGLTATAFVEGLTAQLLKLPMVTGGVGNALENMNDALFRTRAAIGDALLPAVVPLVEGLAGLLTQVRTLNPDTLRTVVAFAAVAAAAGPLIYIIGGVTSAVATLATALSLGMAVAGPLVLALGVLAVSYAKTGLDALAAAADAEAAAAKFKSALLSMNDDALKASFQAKNNTLNALIRTRNALSDDLRRMGAASDQFGNPLPARPSTFVRVARAAESVNNTLGLGDWANRPVAVESSSLDAKREQLATINGMINDRARELGDVGQELAARQARALEPKPPALDLTGGADKLAAQRRALQDLTGDMRALFMFSGATFKTDLPQNIQQQLTLVDGLTDRIATARAALDKMGAAAPTGATQAFARLNVQLEVANRTLLQMADTWNNLPAKAPTIGMLSSGSINGFGRFNPLADRTLNPTGRDTSLTSSIFGKGLGENAGLASNALNALKESALQTGRTLLSAFQQAAASGGQFASSVSASISDAMKGGESLGAAAPQALALAGAMEVATGLFRVLQPALDAIMVPLQMFGEILGTLMIPVLRLVFPVFKVVAIAASYLGEILAKVAGAIATAIGSLVRGLGRLVNKLPGSPGDPLVKAGQAMIDLGNSFKDAAKEMAERRKELEGLSFDDAMKKTSDAADRLTESLINAAEGFKIDRFRFSALRSGDRATGGEGSAMRSARRDTPQTVVQQSVSISPTIVLNGSEEQSGAAMYRKLWHEMRDLVRGNPAFAPHFAAYPEPR